MAKDFSKTGIIKSKDGKGLLWKLPVGTETSLDPAVPLPATAECIGTISEGGTTLSENTDSGDGILDSDGDTVRQGSSSSSKTLTFTLWEIDRKSAMEMIYNPADITAEADGTITGYDESGRTPVNCKLIMEFETDNDRIGRRTYHVMSFASRGEEVINYQGLAGREVTYNIMRDSETGTFFQTRVADRVAGE